MWGTRTISGSGPQAVQRDPAQPQTSPLGAIRIAWSPSGATLNGCHTEAPGASCMTVGFSSRVPLSLYPHAHAVVPEGVFVASADGQSARFIRQDPPSDEDVATVVSGVEHRLTRVLVRWRARRQRDSASDSDAADILPACAGVPRKLRPRAPPRSGS